MRQLKSKALIDRRRAQLSLHRQISEELQKRQEGLPKDIIDIAWKAQLRLCRCYQRLMQRGKHYNLMIAAIAREMIAYIWAIAKEVVLTPVDPKLRLSRVPA
jgi:hypothetical protein